MRPASFPPAPPRLDLVTPLISIIVPTYNRADFVPAAIDSVLAQTYSPFEVVVIDDASIDDTAARMQRFASDARISFLRNDRNVGIAPTRNRGIAASSGPYIALLDSDDVWLDRTKLEAQVARMVADPECALIGTDATVIDRDGRVTGSIRNMTSDAAIRRTLFVKNQFVTSSVMIRRAALDAVGVFDEAFGMMMEDYELWLRIARRFRVANLRAPMTGYRIHTGNITRGNHQASHDAFDRLYEKYRDSYPFAWILRVKMWRERRALGRLQGRVR